MRKCCHNVYFLTGTIVTLAAAARCHDRAPFVLTHTLRTRNFPTGKGEQPHFYSTWHDKYSCYRRKTGKVKNRNDLYLDFFFFHSSHDFFSINLFDFFTFKKKIYAISAIPKLYYHIHPSHERVINHERCCDIKKSG